MAGKFCGLVQLNNQQLTHLPHSLKRQELVKHHVALGVVVTCRDAGHGQLGWAFDCLTSRDEAAAATRTPPTCTLCHNYWLPVRHNRKRCPLTLGNRLVQATADDVAAYKQQVSVDTKRKIYVHALPTSTRAHVPAKW